MRKSGTVNRQGDRLTDRATECYRSERGRKRRSEREREREAKVITD